MGGGGKQTSTTNTVSEPPAFLRPFLQEAVGELQAQHRAQPTAPGFFPGDTVANFAPEAEAALQLQAARALGGSPLTIAAQGQLTDTMAGRYLNPLENANFQAGIAAAQRPVVDAFTHQVLPGITGQFAQGGRSDSGLHHDAVARATNDLTRNLSDAAVKAASDLYGSERQNQVLGMKYAPQLAQQDYFDINQLGTVGTLRQAQQQAEIDAARERYNYDQTAQFNWINQYLQALNNSYPGGTSSSSSTVRGGPSGFQSALGTGLSVASLALPFVMSDARVKQDIEPVGVAFNGLPIYSYHYAWGGPTQLGFLAQDVERVLPEAVTELGGIKHVDVDLAKGLFA